MADLLDRSGTEMDAAWLGDGDEEIGARTVGEEGGTAGCGEEELREDEDEEVDEEDGEDAREVAGEEQAI